MITEPIKGFLPLFRSWFDTAAMAEKVGVSGSPENLLAELDLGPMVEAEPRLLNHTPVSAAEAACMLEVVRQNMVDAGRSDGLDLRALTAVQRWLADHSTGAADDQPVERLLRQAQG